MQLIFNNDLIHITLDTTHWQYPTFCVHLNRLLFILFHRYYYNDFIWYFFLLEMLSNLRYWVGGWVGWDVFWLLLSLTGSGEFVYESYCSLLCLTGLLKILTACLTCVACHSRTTGSLCLGHDRLLRPCFHPPSLSSRVPQCISFMVVTVSCQLVWLLRSVASASRFKWPKMSWPS